MRSSTSRRYFGGFEWFHALISVAVFHALREYRTDILKVIGACAAAGLVYTHLA